MVDILLQRLLLIQVCFLLSTQKISVCHELSKGNVEGYEVLEGNSCLRKCMEPRESKICEFKFKVEWWHTMTQDCLSCPQNIDDCYNKNCITGDGNSRLVRLVNKQLPGPSIQVCEGDVIRVKVENRLLQGEGFSIHWHGIQQIGTPFSDGVPYVTQYYIDSGQSYDYEFVAEPAGTHYWHSHSGMEMGDGVGGPLIVRRPIEWEENAHLYDKDLPEHHVFFQTFRETIEKVAFLTSQTDSERILVPIKSFLINGRSQRIADEGGNLTPMTLYNVKQGKRYRFRIIFAGPSGCEPILYIDQHPMLVIATEVGSIEPIRVDALALASGQRFDIVVDAKERVGKYYIIIDGSENCGGKEGIQQPSRAILEYEGADPDSHPFEPKDLIKFAKESEFDRLVLLNSFSDERTTGFNAIPISNIKMIATSDERIQGYADKNIYLKSDTLQLKNISADFLLRLRDTPVITLLNDIAFKKPPIPLISINNNELGQYTCNTESLAQDGVDCSLFFCECTHFYHVSLGSLVEIHLLTTYDDTVLHPMHLHGSSFYVVGEGIFEKETSIEEYKSMDEAGLIPRNFVQAPEIDTVTPHRKGYSILRFRADNPGWWMFHCHLEFHIEWGMSLVLVVDDNGDEQ